GRLVELLLRPEEPEQVGLRDAGPAGDVLGRGAVEAALGELHHRRLEDLVLPLRRREPGGGGRVHGRKVSDDSLACQAKGRNASTTRSRSSSESCEWNGSASARA